MDASPDAAAAAMSLWQQAATPGGRSALWRKYRSAILIGAGVAGVGALGVGTYWYWSRYSQWKEQQEVEQMKRDVELRRLRDEMALARAAEEATRADSQLQTHFESIQLIADTTTLPSVMPHLKSGIFSIIDLTPLTQALVASRGQGQEQGQPPLSSAQKMKIWEDLKILSFTRALGSMWATALVFLFVRIQLNVLGRHVYIHTAEEVPGSSEDGAAARRRQLTMSCQHKFLAFSDYLPHYGLASLLEDVKSAMTKALQTKSLKDKFSLDQLWTLLRDLKAEFESSHDSQWHQYLLPAQNVLPEDLAEASSVADTAQSRRLGSGSPQGSSSEELAESTRGGALADAMAGGFLAASGAGEATDLAEAARKVPKEGDEGLSAGADPDSQDIVFAELMAETRLVLNSVSFRQVLSATLDAISELAMEELMRSAFSQQQAPGPQPAAVTSIALAKLLPHISSVAVSLLELENNNYLNCLSSLQEMTSFSARVYAGQVNG